MSRSKKNRVGGALHPRGNYAKTRAATLDDMYLHLLMELALNRFSWVEYADAQSSGVPNALDSSASGTTDIDMPASYDAGIGGVL